MQEDYPAVPLLRTLAETEEKAIRKHGESLRITFGFLSFEIKTLCSHELL